MCKPADLAQNALSQLSLIIEACHGILLLRFFRSFGELGM